MIVLGLAGKAGAGKDTVADYLVRRYGFIKFAFSDALYREVAAAFSVTDEKFLRDRALKDEDSASFALEHCADDAFVEVATKQIDARYAKFGGPGLLAPWKEPLSPRQILQWWGTEYRRAQDPNYWINATGRWLVNFRALFKYPEQRPQLFVNTTVRFPNEREFIHEGGVDGYGWDGQVWHIRRDSAAPVAAHVSETPLEVWKGERELYNNDTIERLYNGIELMLTTQAEFVRVEPMAPYEPPAELPINTDRRDAEDTAARDADYSKGH